MGLSLSPCGCSQRDPLKPNSGRIILLLRIPYGSPLSVKSKVPAVSPRPHVISCPCPFALASGGPPPFPQWLRLWAPSCCPTTRSSGPLHTPFLSPENFFLGTSTQLSFSLPSGLDSAAPPGGACVGDPPAVVARPPPAEPTPPSPTLLSPLSPCNLFIVYVISFPLLLVCSRAGLCPQNLEQCLVWSRGSADTGWVRESSAWPALGAVAGHLPDFVSYWQRPESSAVPLTGLSCISAHRLFVRLSPSAESPESTALTSLGRQSPV